MSSAPERNNSAFNLRRRGKAFSCRRCFCFSYAVLLFSGFGASALEIARVSGPDKDGSAAFRFSGEFGGFIVEGVRLVPSARSGPQPQMPVYCSKSGRRYADITLRDKGVYAAVLEVFETGKTARVVPAGNAVCVKKSGALCLTGVRSITEKMMKAGVIFEDAVAADFMLYKVSGPKRSYFRMSEPDGFKAEGGLHSAVRKLILSVAEGEK